MSCRVFPLTVQKFEHEQIQLFLSIQFSYNNKLSSSLDMMYKLFSKLLKSPWKDSEGFEIFKITNFERFRNFLWIFEWNYWSKISSNYSRAKKFLVQKRWNVDRVGYNFLYSAIQILKK